MAPDPTGGAHSTPPDPLAELLEVLLLREGNREGEKKRGRQRKGGSGKKRRKRRGGEKGERKGKWKGREMRPPN